MKTSSIVVIIAAWTPMLMLLLILDVTAAPKAMRTLFWVIATFMRRTVGSEWAAFTVVMTSVIWGPILLTIGIIEALVSGLARLLLGAWSVLRRKKSADRG